MKKAFIFISLTISNLIFNMQQVGISKASQALAVAAPQLVQARRQYSQEPNNIYGKKYIEANQASIDNFKKEYLRKKYPSIRRIPPIYQFTGPKAELADILPRQIKRIVASERLYALPEGIAVKIGAYQSGKSPIIMYDPKKFDTHKEEEAVLLHELGHANRNLRLLLALYTKLGIKSSFIILTFFKMLSIKYGFIGYILAPRLFWTLYMRFFEEPAADDFMIKHATKDVLRSGKSFFEKTRDTNPILKSRFINTLLDPHHPTLQSRINKIQRAIDGHPNYSQFVRIALLFTITEETIRLMYNYSTDEASIKQGLAKVEEIENNFEAYCDKFEIPAEGRPIYKYALDTVKSYFMTKLYLIELGRAPADIKEEEIIEIITTPTETIVEEQRPEIKERWKPLFPEY